MDKPDVKADAVVEVKPEVAPEVAPEVKPDVADAGDAKDAVDAVDATDVKADTVDAIDATDVKTDAGDAGDTGDGGPITCSATPICTLGAKKCGTGGVQTCVTVAGCPDWSAAVACGGHQECTGAGACTCVAAPDGCTAVGTFCGSDGKLNTCAKDGNCFFVSATAACATDTSCKGALPGASCTCDNACDTVGNFCKDAKTAATCANDGNTPACRIVSATTACGTIKVCTGGACMCPAANGTHENQGCNRDTDANICDGTHILTCVRDSDSGCDIWKVAPNGLCETDNGGGLTCGKGPAGTGPAACQCPARTGGDVYADPMGGSSDTTVVYATGILSPAQCRFTTLTRAIAEANKTNSGVSRIVAVSAEATVFSGETFPLAVPPDVTLTTADATPTPGNYTIRFNSSGSGAATRAIDLKNNSVVTGFTIEAAGNTGATAIVFPTDGAATVSTVAITKGAQSFVHGITVGGSAKATLSSVTVDRTTGSAIDVNTSSTVGITGGMATGSAVGLNVQGGTVNASGFTADSNNIGVSISSSAAPVVNFTGGAVSKSASHGIAVSSGVLTLGPSSSVIGNGGDGLSLSGGSTTVNGSSIGLPKPADSNTNPNANTNGINASSEGTVNLTIDQGTAVDSNRQAGVIAGHGCVLTLKGGSAVRNNGSDGVSLTGGAANINGVTINNNLNGIDINSTGVAIDIGTTGATTTITQNTADGILIKSSELNTANSVTIFSVNVTENSGFGIDITGTGNVFATVKSSLIASNHGTGIIVAQGGGTVKTVFQGNDIRGNNFLRAGDKTVGGVLFATSSTLNGFSGNKIHANVGDQLGFDALPNEGDTWNITQSSACDELANTLSCYQKAHTLGLKIKEGVAANVNATYVRWENDPPAKDVDFHADDNNTQVILPDVLDPKRCAPVTPRECPL